jgi:hypothetical protein
MTDAGRERKELRDAERRAAMTDDRIALEICRSIRDCPDATDRDRLEAIKIISRIKRGA